MKERLDVTSKISRGDAMSRLSFAVRSTVLAALVGVCCGASGLWAQVQAPRYERGFNAERAYDIGERVNSLP